MRVVHEKDVVNVGGYRYASVVCHWTCYPYPGSHYDCPRSPLREQGQSASLEKMRKKLQKQTRSREQARERSHHHAMWKKKWNGKDSEVPDRMAASVRNASDLGAKAEEAEAESVAQEESSAEERSAVTAVAHGQGRVRVHARVYSYAVIQVREAGGFEGAGDRDGEAQGTTTREFADETRT